MPFSYPDHLKSVTYTGADTGKHGTYPAFDEAEEYFYGDLGWDKDSEEVKEFMTIIRNHFL